MSEIKIGIYEHYKGKRYEVIGVGRHSETLEEFGKNSLWVRPKAMFEENIKHQGRITKRFTFIQ